MAEVQVQDKGEKGGKVRSKKQSTRVDMTPMVDLGFLLITFFMFTTTFSKPNVMDLGLPAKPKDEKQAKDSQTEIDLTNSISIILGKDNRVFYHQQDESGLTEARLMETNFDSEGLRSVIVNAKRNAKNKDIFTIIVKPTDDAVYANFVDVLDELDITNNDRYGITDIKDWEQKIYDAKVGN